MWRSKKSNPLPPGPKGFPFVGNLLEFRRDPLAFLTNLARDYGDIASFRLGKQLAFQVNHPDLIKDILVTHGKNFRKTRVLERAKRVIGEGLLTSNGDFHLRQRRLAQPAFSRERLLAYGEAMVQCADHFERRWTDGQVVNMSAEMLRLTLAIAGHTLFGADIKESAEDVRHAMTIVFEYFNRLMLPFAGMIETLPLPSRRRFKTALNRLDQTVYEMIEARRKDDCDRGDLLSMLLFAQDNEMNGESMTDLQVRDEAMTLFLAGHETTATWLTWTWYLLSQNPESLERVQQELSDELDNRPPRVDDLKNLSYLRMVLAESLRMYPPVWTLTRRAISDYQIGEFMLPAGAIVGMSQYVMHRDPRYFPEPDRFDPCRWEPEAIEKRPKFSYFPFGGGSRVCIGEQFAWMEATLLMASLARKWKASVVEGYELRFQPLITLRPKPDMPMRLERVQVDRHGPVRPKSPTIANSSS